MREASINHLMCEIEEYVMILRRETCLRPPIEPTRAEVTAKPLTKFSMLWINIKEITKEKGINF
jgi:hypothetical protein